MKSFTKCALAIKIRDVASTPNGDILEFFYLSHFNETYHNDFRA